MIAEEVASTDDLVTVFDVSLPPVAPVTSAKGHQAVDLLESLILSKGPIELPAPVHRLTPGLYSRELTMPANTLFTSKVHKTEHQYIVSKGVCDVWLENIGWHRIVAPFHGITLPGSRRVLRIIEETTWTTFHPSPLVNIAELEESLVETREIKPLNEALKHIIDELPAGFTPDRFLVVGGAE